MNQPAYTTEVYDKAYKDSVAYTDHWNQRALLAVMAHLTGVPTSFLDVGCGSGELVKLMHKFYPMVCVGIDISDRHYDIYDIRKYDLRKPVDLGRLFQLVISWEVGEHLPPESADTYCETLARHVYKGGYLVFTAAAPNQGGNYHINEQPQCYWQKKLESRGLTYLVEETERLAETWRWCTGMCFWLHKNVQVFRR